MYENYLQYDDVPGWCAGLKVSGINNDNVATLNEEEILQKAADRIGSVALVSVSAKEEQVIAWLLARGWYQGPWYENHGYKEGHMTCLFSKQVPRELFDEDNLECNEGF